MVISVSFEQSRKTLSEISVILFGMSITERPAQPSKAPTPIEAVLSLSVTMTSAVQFSNAVSPIVATPDRSTDVSAVQFLNVPSSMAARVGDRVISFNCEHPEKASVPIAETFSRFPISVSSAQFLNAPAAISSIVSGRSIVCKAVDSNALAPTLVTSTPFSK